MATLDLSGMSSAELTALRASVLAAYQTSLAAAASSGTSYQVPGLSKAVSASSGGASSAQLLEQLGAITSEIAARADDTYGIGVVEFGDPS